MNEIKSIIKYSKLISIERTGMDDANQMGIGPFEDLEYLNTINIQYSEILSNVTTRGYWKLFFLRLKIVRFGRSTFHYFMYFHYYFALSTNMNHHHLFHRVPNFQFEWIVMMEDLFKSLHSNSFNTFKYC